MYFVTMIYCRPIQLRPEAFSLFRLVTPLRNRKEQTGSRLMAVRILSNVARLTNSTFRVRMMMSFLRTFGNSVFLLEICFLNELYSE